MKRLAALSLALLLSGCGHSNGPKPPDPPKNKDPRQGIVDLDIQSGYYTSKKCDGSTLLYFHAEGIAAIPNSSECAPQ